MIAGRSCADCEAFMWNDDADRMGDRIILLAGGDRWERPKGVPTPCHLCPKVPRDRRTGRATRADAIDPSPESWSILWHHRECRAVGDFRDDSGTVDPLVRHHAGLIDGQERQVAAMKMENVGGLLSLLFKGNIV